MTETYNAPDAYDAEQDNADATVYPFPQRDRTPDDADGLDVPEFLREYQQERRALSGAATGSRIVEGVVINRGPGAGAGPRAARRRRARSRARAAWALARIVGAHPGTRGALRQAVYVAAGVRLGARRAWESQTPAVHQQMMRAAAAAGNHEMALEWEERAARFRTERHARRMALLSSPVHAARGVAHGIIAGFLVLTVVGVSMAIYSHHVGDVTAPFVLTADVVMFAYRFVNVAWRPVLEAMPPAALLAAWFAGRRKGEVPAWLGPAGALPALPDTSFITPSIVVIALRDLGVSMLRKAITDMADGAAAMLGPITLAGAGVEVDVYLPSGVQTPDILDRHQKLAENLGRHRHELYITVPAERARTVRLWIADHGALDEPIEPSPLLTDPDMTVNWFTGAAPWGVDQRRNPVLFRPYQRHVLITGLSNHGKTAAIRAAALWAALDPCTEFRIADLKGVGDWGMFDGMATVLIQGPTDEHVMATTEMVEAAAEEMERRLLAVQGLDAKNGVDEKLGRRAGSGFHPLIVIVDEAQVAIMCPAVDNAKNPYGGFKNRSRFFNACRRIQNQGRAVNVTLWLGTQDPNPQNFPLMLRNGSHVRSALPLGSEGQAKMVLGEDAVNAGAAPHRLRRGIDKGVVVVTGEGVDFPAGQPHLTVWSHFIDGDGAHQVADNAKARRSAVVTGDGRAPAEDAAPLDVLTDVAAILGGAPRALVQDVMRALAERDARYREWTNADFKAAMESAGAPTYPYDGRMHVHGGRVREALAARISATENQ